MPAKKPQGNKPTFPLEGEVALMFLKPYTGLSDDGLVEMLNSNLHMQMFCGVLIDPARLIKDGKIVSAIRNRLAHYLDIKELQKIRGGRTYKIAVFTPTEDVLPLILFIDIVFSYIVLRVGIYIYENSRRKSIFDKIYKF